MSRLFIVSNRMSVPAGHGRPVAGGMAVALDAALHASGGVWLGWSGALTADEADPMPTHLHQRGNVTYATIDLTRRDQQEYYDGYANRTLWPLFHYRPGLTDFARRDMSGYYRVNRAFARALAPMLEPDDIIWVHDYHLIPLASELRARGVTNRIGFFLHIPWPAADLFLVLPNHAQIARGLADYDLVGFQTPDDVDNFLSYLSREAAAVHLADGVTRAFGRRFRVGAFPVGIDAEETRRFARANPSKAMQRLLASLGGTVLALGVDRLDYSKGIGPRLEAIARLLELYPEHRRRFSFLQIAPKSRETIPEYAALSKEVAELTGRINGAFGEIDWQPIRYINRTIARTTLAGFYRAARACLVTPLRDGMNLVAKEFVAAQDPDDPGMLILSRFAGAARELREALLVNPYDIDSMAHALHNAFVMDVAERRDRWAALNAKVCEGNVHNWSSKFLSALAETRGGPGGDIAVMEKTGGGRSPPPRNALLPLP